MKIYSKKPRFLKKSKKLSKDVKSQELKIIKNYFKGNEIVMK